MAKKQYDFSGWATRFDIKCADGRTIKDGAFNWQDGETVPLVYMHDHFDPKNVLGHALLKYAPGKGMRADVKFNNTAEGQHSKEMVRNGDVLSLSIWADGLKEDKTTGEVYHGNIKEVSLVLAGANPEARIDMPFIQHGDGLDGYEAIIFAGPQDLIHGDMEEEGEEMADTNTSTNDERTVQDVIDEFDDEQKAVMKYLLDQKEEEILNALEEMDDEEEDNEAEDDSVEEDGDEMKHNAFDTDTRQGNYLSHDDMKAIMSDARKMGSLREAVEAHMESGVLAHSTITPIPMDGMTGPSSDTASQTYGIRDMDMLFPEFHNLNNPPAWIKRDTDWVSKVMNGVHHTPFSRIKSVYANITEDDARALGYIKGNQKKEEVFSLLKRTTTPQTVYKKQKFDKDDLTDITDFDVVAWVKAEMRIMLDEEIARAILIGDGRAADSDDHIKHEHVRPIATDVDLFNIKVNVTVPGDATPGVIAKKFIDDVIRARKYYKGSGNPKMFTTADMLTEMLLLEDNIGHKLYKSVGELATTLRVSEIVEVEVMEGQKINGKDLAAIIVNLNDYNVGADKGGAVSLFDDFDIDYNQYKYLIETRCSGALIKPFSAMTVCIATANA